MNDIVAIAKERATRFRVRNVVVATNTGATANRVLEVFGPDYLVIAVGNPASAHQRGLVYHQGVTEETRRSLEQKGVKVVLQDQSLFQAVAIGGQSYFIGNTDITGPPPNSFNTDWQSSLESVVKHAGPKGPYNAVAVISNTLGWFGDGPRVCIEIALMAADSGVLPLDEDCIAVQRRISGDSNMPDTAMILRPAKSQDVFKGALRVKDLVLVPGPKDHWLSNGPLWVG